MQIFFVIFPITLFKIGRLLWLGNMRLWIFFKIFVLVNLVVIVVYLEVILFPIFILLNFIVIFVYF